MKKLIIAATLSIIIPTMSHAGGMVICGHGKSSSEAVSDLNKTLSSTSGVMSSQSYDGDNKRVDLAITDVTSASGVTIIDNYWNGVEIGACVTIFGKSKKVSQ